jgi:WhiB family redox-sensing transcriptional regulator
MPQLAAYRQDIQWQEAAICRQADPEIFFPVGSAGPAAAEAQRAKAVCAGCPVHRPCLVYALATGQEFGIWGGRDETERRLLRRQWRQSRIAASQLRATPHPPATGRFLSRFSLPGSRIVDGEEKVTIQFRSMREDAPGVVEL